MAFDYEIVAWEGFPGRGQTRGNRYLVDHDREGNAKLPRADRVHGVKVVLVDQDKPERTHQFWIFTLQRYNKWGQWYVHIVAMSTRHGLEMADETIPPDPTEGEDF